MTALSVAAVLTVAGTAARRVTGLTSLSLSDAICAPAATCACAPRDNLALYGLLEQAPVGSALVIDAGGRLDGGYFGELVAEEREEELRAEIRAGRRLADLLGLP